MIKFSRLIDVKPNIRFEKNGARAGFNWGKPARQSNILKVLGVLSCDGRLDEAACRHLGIAGEDTVAELWIASDDIEYPSMVEVSEGRSMPLHELLAESGREVLGDRHVDVYGPHMGVLMKLIDTADDPRRGSLSVQVHAQKDHPFRPAKPEMWKGRGKIYIGWNRDMTPEMVRSAAAAGELEKYLNAVDIDPSLFINVPGGLVHAIRYGTFLTEWSKTNVRDDHTKGSVKQATVRLYDRTDGKTPRRGKEDLDAALELLSRCEEMSAFDLKHSRDIVKTVHPAADRFYRLFATDDVVIDEARIEGAVQASVRHQGYPVYVESGAVDVYCAGRCIDRMTSGGYRIVPHVLQEVEFRRTSSGPAVIQRWFPPL